MLTKVAVLATVSDSSGNPQAGATITAKLDRTDVDASGGYVLPEVITATTDVNGQATLMLWPNELGSTESSYLIAIANPDSGKTERFAATIPNAACNLHEVANLPAYEGKSDGQLAIDAAVAAVAPAVAAKVAAEAAADESSQAAQAAAGSAQAAATSEGLAAGSAETAGNHAATASTHKDAAAGSAADAAGAAQAAGNSAGAAQVAEAAASSHKDAAAQSALTAQGHADNVLVAVGNLVADAEQHKQAAAVSAALAIQYAESDEEISRGVYSAKTHAGLALGYMNGAAEQRQLAEVQAGLAADHAVSAAASKNAALAVNINVAAAQGAADEAQEFLAGTTSAATQAANARDQAIAAWAAASAPGETLAAMSQSIHSGSVVDAFLYDTSKDTDSGAWRKRCQHTSWYNEAINGAWLGQKANELAARGDNLLANAENLSAWSVFRATKSENVEIAPDGTLTADKLVEDTTAALNHGITLPTYTAVAGSLYAFTLRVKAGERSWLLINAGPCSAYFNVATGVVGSTASGTIISKTIAPDPSGKAGWYVITMLFAATATSHSPIAYLAISDNGNTYNGDGTSGLYLWGAKVNKVGEQSSTYSGSPELVANPNFDSASGWTDASTGTGTATVSGGVLTTTRVDTNNRGKFRQVLATEANKYYALNVVVTGTNANILIGTTAGGSDIATFSPPPGQFVFKATGSATHIELGSVGTATWDSISVKEITVLATPYVPYSTLAGQYYQNTTDGKYYSLNATYGQTETFRGNSREFPALAGIVAESGRVVVYDLSAVGAPMWAVLRQNPTIGTSGDEWWRQGKSVTSIFALNGRVWFGLGNAGDGACGLAWADFTSDTAGRYSTAASVGGKCGYAVRNSAVLDDSLVTIVSSGINDVAATVLPGAPVDPATGLPVPYIVVHTAGGVSVIKDNGTVASHAFTGLSIYDTLGISNGVLYYGNAQSISGFRAIALKDITGPSFSGAQVSAGWSAGKLVSMAGTNLASIHHNSALAATGLAISRANLATPANSMRAVITNAYNTGWQVGDARGTYLCDTTAEVIAASGELVTNGSAGFTDTTGWTAANGTISVIGGALRVMSDGTAAVPRAMLPIVTEVGKTYTVQVGVGTTQGGWDAIVGTGAGNNNVADTPLYSSTKESFSFVAQSTTSHISLRPNTITNGQYTDFASISVKLASPDRSVKNNSLVINGSLTKTAVAAGAQLVSFGGWSAANYLETAVDPLAGVTTGDFSIRLLSNLTATTSSTKVLFDRADPATDAGQVSLYRSGAFSQIRAVVAGTTITSSADMPVGRFNCIDLVRRSGVVEIWADGVLIGSGAAAGSIALTNCLVRVGVNARNGTAFPSPLPASGVEIALARVSATAISADQVVHAHRTELAMFQPGAKVTIDGTSTAVTALGYDEDTELLHVGTSWGRSAFKGLVRVESSATAVGSKTAIAAGMGALLVGGSSSARYAAPAIALRDALKWREAKRAMSKEAIPLDFDAIAAQVDFNLPAGYSAREVFVGGAVKREGATKDFTVVTDGFKETVRFGTAPGAGAWVRVMMVRSF